jgi:hypothetical protein
MAGGPVSKGVKLLVKLMALLGINQLRLLQPLLLQGVIG